MAGANVRATAIFWTWIEKGQCWFCNGGHKTW
jgi:hypothetical protein